MSRQRIWFERSFDLGVPLAAVPDLIERLRGTPFRLVERTARASSEALTQRRDTNWSIQEHVGHLLDLEALWLGRLDDLEAGAEAMRAADLKNHATWEANHNTADLASLLDAFSVERGIFLGRVAALDQSVLARAALHPRLMKPMTVADLCFFVAEHDDHHLAAITEMLEV